MTEDELSTLRFMVKNIVLCAVAHAAVLQLHGDNSEYTWDMDSRLMGAKDDLEEFVSGLVGAPTE